MHRDRVTGIDLVFAGEMPRGIFSGAYDASAPGRIKWAATPELSASNVTENFPGLGSRLRVSSFADANGRLYAAVGQTAFERADGPAPTWRAIYTNPYPGYSETGLRGLTALRDETGHDVLLAAVEGNAARIIRLDPATGTERTELNIRPFLSQAWGMPVGYAIAAYNDMTQVQVPGVGSAILIGLMAFIQHGSPAAPGHKLVDVGYGQVEGGGWYLVRWPNGRYDVRRIEPSNAAPLVAVRSIRVSPFPGDRGTLYFAGYDANKAPAHNIGWIIAADPGTLSGR